MTEYVICFVVSGGEFVSVVDFKGYDDLTLLLLSEATSEALWFNLPKVIKYYKIYLSCKRDVTSSVVEGITTYTIVLSECPGEKTEWELYFELFKNGEHIPSTDYLTIKENQQSTLGNVTTVSFNRSSLMNDNVDLKFFFICILIHWTPQKFGINGFTTLIKEVYWATTKFVLSEQTMNV